MISLPVRSWGIDAPPIDTRFQTALINVHGAIGAVITLVADTSETLSNGNAFPIVARIV